MNKSAKVIPRLENSFAEFLRHSNFADAKIKRPQNLTFAFNDPDNDPVDSYGCSVHANRVN